MTLQSQLTFKSLEDTSIAVERNPIAPSQRVIAEDDDEDDDGKAAPSSAAAAPGPAGANASRKDQLDAVSSYLSHAQANGQAQQKPVHGGGGGGVVDVVVDDDNCELFFRLGIPMMDEVYFSLMLFFKTSSPSSLECADRASNV